MGPGLCRASPHGLKFFPLSYKRQGAIPPVLPIPKTRKNAMTALLSLHPALLWFLFGIFCFMAEMLLPGFLVFFFGLGAWCAALVALAPGMPFAVQLVVFLVTSIASLFWLRARFQRLCKGGVSEMDVADDFVPQGELAEVVEAVAPPAAGKVKYGGSFWQAVSEAPIAKGELARVVAKNNLSLTVEPVRASEKTEEKGA